MVQKAEARYRIKAQDDSAPGLRQAEGRLRRFRARIQQTLAGAATRLSGPLAAVGGIIAGWSASIIKAANDLDTLGKAAKRAGQSAEDMERLTVAADRLGERPEKFSRMFEQIAEAIEGARENLSGYRRAFADLGIDYEKLARLSGPEQLLAIQQGLAGIEDPARRTAVRRDVAGRNVATLFGKDLEGALREADLLGSTRDLDELTRDAEAFNDARARLWKVLVQDPMRGAGGIVMPALTEAMNALTERIALGRRGGRPAPQGFRTGEELAELLAPAPSAMTGPSPELRDVLFQLKRIGDNTEHNGKLR